MRAHERSRTMTVHIIMHEARLQVIFVVVLHKRDNSILKIEQTLPQYKLVLG